MSLPCTLRLGRSRYIFFEISSERSRAGRDGAQPRASLIVIGAPAVYLRVQNESVDVAEATKGQ
ncbi:MAG: hypothetical protein KTU85_12630 [Acidimicrobiia bacterium]|nr:hypothetical protein [Acidimicrobiia bacterium]